MQVADTTTLGAATCDGPRTSQGGRPRRYGQRRGAVGAHSDTTLGGDSCGDPRHVVVAVITLLTMVVWDQYSGGSVCEGVREDH